MLSVAAGMVALELVVSARYGFHRDELYFLACSRHLAWGYVDQPPLVPAVAWLATHLFGTSASALRAIPALAAGGTCVLAGLMARELGGRGKAQLLAALAAGTSPQVLAAFHLLSTAAFDMFFWAAICFVLLRILRTANQRLWPMVGALCGLGLLNKLNVLFLVVAVGIGMLLAGRWRMCVNRWSAAGAAIGLAMWSSNIAWNAEHRWAAVSMLHSLHQENSGLGPSLGFIPSQLVVVGPALVVLWLPGLRGLLRSAFARPLGLAYVALVLMYTVTGGKSYYLAGMYFVLFAAGGVCAEQRSETREPSRGLGAWPVLIVAGAVVALPLSLPVLPETALAKGPWEGNINKDLSATTGWSSLVRQVGAVASGLPPRQRQALVVFTGDYGAAG
ncbi:MAG: glycosyltransferase family 39 protein, partial [Acidimicrobiales bacterium]|nr:glycosyltransferase family 39 protein [Acidimicrobiales bacterium]